MRRHIPKRFVLQVPVASAKKRSIYVAKRFAVRLAIICLFALAQIPLPWGFSGGLQLMLLFSVLISVGLAIYRRETLLDNAFGYWDEAGALLLLLLCVRVVAMILTCKLIRVRIVAL
ncbi:MAG TPA: hypothetical protein VIJ62_12850 [Rhizomicrobium sp.]